MGSEHYCLRWNNHQSNLLGVFSQLLRDESLVDVTLACSEGHSIRAHKVVLSACSSYFQTLFVDHPSRHPIVILKDVRFAELRTLIEFMYKGEVNVEYCQLSALLKTAESLKVKGLAEMTREYKQEPEQTEPTELVGRRQQAPPPPQPPQQQHVIQQHPPSRSPSIEENDRLHQASQSPPVHQNLRLCRSPPMDHQENEEKRPAASPDNLRSSPATSDCGPSDMSIHSNSNNMVASCSGMNAPIICQRLPSPLSEPLPGPSNLPPVQQVPLSLKKEVDWSGNLEEKNTGESSSDFSRHPHEPELEGGGSREDSPRLYPCMYCGSSFPHQSKLTRHILSHSLETLKYREQLQQHASSLGAAPEAGGFLESHFSGRAPAAPHEPPDPEPPTPMDLDVGDGTAMGCGGGGVVLCKFCGKSFPDVSSLIAHLPVHTGDRPFKCEFCGKAFKLRHHMKDHCRVHTGERPFRCTLCGKTFSRSTILKAHEKTHYPKYVRKFLSPSPLDTEEESPHAQADMERPLSSPLERPSSTQSSRSSTPFALPFPTLPTSILEVGLIHPSLLGDEMYRCPSCMAAFPSIWLLEQHTALQHIGSLNSLEKPFICEQCGQSYRYRSAYVKHREQNHRARLPADKLFSCDVCGMQFRYLKSFKKHRLNHALEKLHGKSGGDTAKNAAIDSPDNNSIRPGNVENSSDQVSSSNETIVLEGRDEIGNSVEIKKETLSDDFAGEGASSDVEKLDADQDDTIDSMALSFPVSSGTTSLDILRNSHDSSIISFLRADAAEKQRERRFACPFCGKCVRSKENLKLHVRKHTGERPFVCLFCGRAFGGKSDLTRHLRIHTGERPYHCDMCGKCFARADYLSKHLTTHINTSR